MSTLWEIFAVVSFAQVSFALVSFALVSFALVSYTLCKSTSNRNDQIVILLQLWYSNNEPYYSIIKVLLCSKPEQGSLVNVAHLKKLQRIDCLPLSVLCRHGIKLLVRDLLLNALMLENFNAYPSVQDCRGSESDLVSDYWSGDNRLDGWLTISVCLVGCKLLHVLTLIWIKILFRIDNKDF